MSVQTSSKEIANIENNVKTIENGLNIKTYIYLGIKRLIDIIGALIGVILLVPVTLLIYIVSIILKENDGPLFYSQKELEKTESILNYINLDQCAKMQMIN